jgi:hypothetical protein
MYESGGEGVGFRGWQLSGRGTTHSSVADQSLPVTYFPPGKGIHAKEGCHVQPPVDNSRGNRVGVPGLVETSPRAGAGLRRM